MKVNRHLGKFILTFLFSSLGIMSQNDSIPFSLTDLYSLILKNHPVLKQADLLSSSAKAQLLQAKGALDPKFSSSLLQKDFESKNYFTLWENKLKVPLWYGPEIKAGFDQANGDYLGDENTLPSSGLAYVGISVPLAQDLLIDERRKVIRQSKLMVKIAEAERSKVINKLFLTAAKDYSEWYFDFLKYQRYKQGFEFAKNRFQFTIQRIIHGDAAPIDSVEASIQMNNLKILMQQSRIEFINAGLILSNYLWKEGEVPAELNPLFYPFQSDSEFVPISADTLQKLFLFAASNHPEIVKTVNKIKQLEIETNFAKNKLLPKLNVDYNFLSRGNEYGSLLTPSGFFQTNYKLGGNFSFPLFLRQERGKLKMTKYKLTETKYDFALLSRMVSIELQNAYNEAVLLAEQVLLQKNVVAYSRRLRDAEEINFENGESSVFLINAREMSLITNEIKEVELRSKFIKANAQVYFYSGYFTRLFSLN